MEQVLEQVADYYAATLAAHGITARGLDWRDQESQERRFVQLMELLGPQRTGSIVDVGCGWGAFALWAARRGYDLDYTGYDISREQLDAAQKACSAIPKARFVHGCDNFAPADYVVASGIFNVRFDAPDHQWREYVDRTIDEMAKASRVGFAFNCLTGFSDADRKVGRLYYPYPGEMLDAVMSRHGRHACLLTNYGLYEFTVMVWKNAPMEVHM